MTRSRLYVLMDAFEADMRGMLSRYVLDHLDEEAALGPSYEQANLRREGDGAAGAEQSAVFYLDMREAYDILNRHREVLPTDLGRELRAHTPDMDRLVPIRNRVMHGRPLHDGDPEVVVSVCRVFKTRYWEATERTLDRLISDPLWEPAFQRQPAYSDRVLHNLPLPEYDETGLIGRAQDCKAIVRQLMRRREPMVTITGEGGIGKTATALEVAYTLVDDPDSPYDCILWVSLKTERLTAGGVETIVSAVRDIHGAAMSLGSAFDSDFRGGLRELAEALEGLESLLIIDNLETVHGDEVVELYDTLPDTVTYLFTSRVGVGQLERRIPLGPLGDKDAPVLLRSFARSRGVERLATLSQETMRKVVAELRNSPLAIRWYVLAVEAGEEPLRALNDQGSLIDFCVRSVYDRMSRDAAHVLAVLFAVNRSVTFDEISILAEMNVDALTRAVRELTTGSMVKLERDPDAALVSRIALTEAAQLYLGSVNPPEKAALDRILANEQDFRKAAELRRAEERARRLAPNVVRTRSPHDEPVAHILRRALTLMKRGDSDNALAEVKNARSLNQEYWEVDRVEGFILSASGQVDAATSAYQAALLKADEVGRAVTSYFLAGHLARKAHEPERAIQYAKVAHEHFGMADTAKALGDYLVWVQQFAKGQRYLEAALDKAEGKLRLITLTALVDSWRRWSEYLLEHERKANEAAQKALAGFRSGLEEISSGIYDHRLAGAVMQSINMYIRCITVRGFDPSSFDRQSIYMLRAIEPRINTFRMSRGAQFLPAYLTKLASISANPEIRHLCENIYRSLELSNGGYGAASVDLGEEPHEGEIIRWMGTYGFIANPTYSNGIFFPAVAIEGLTSRGEDIDLCGTIVAFIPKRGHDGRPRADWVKILHPSTSVVIS